MKSKKLMVVFSLFLFFQTFSVCAAPRIRIPPSLVRDVGKAAKEGDIVQIVFLLLCVPLVWGLSWGIVHLVSCAWEKFKNDRENDKIVRGIMLRDGSFKCPYCGKVKQVEESFIGIYTRCPCCKKVIQQGSDIHINALLSD